MSEHIYHIECPNPEGGGTHALAVHEWGDKNNPRILWCVHGLTRNAQDFHFLAQELKSHYRILAPDVAGRGKSAWFHNPLWYNNAVYMMDMLRAMRALELKKVDWVGTSMGGIIGMLAAATAPDHFGKMVLNDIGATIPGAALMRIASYVGTSPSYASLEEAYPSFKETYAPWGIKEDAHLRHMLTHSLIQKDGRFHAHYDPNIGALFKDEKGAVKSLEDFDLWPIFNKITAPLLIVRGAVSDLFPRDVALAMQQSRAGISLVEFEGIGHAPSLMDAAQIEILKNWLLT